MSLVVTFLPGYTVTATGDLITPAKLNALAHPTFSVTGTIGAADIGAGAVTAPKQRVDAYGYGGTTAGTASAYTLDFATALEAPALIDGLSISCKMHVDCLVNPTLNVDSLGAKQIVGFLGTNLVAGDLKLNQVVQFRYSTSGAGVWVLQNQTPVVVTIPTPAVYTPITGWGGDVGRMYARRSGAAPNTQVQFWHEGMTLRHRTTGATYFATAVGGAICDITVAGLGGLDTGAEAVSTWYYLWLMSDGTSQYLVLSLSASAPATLGAYSFIGLVGSVFNNAAGNFHSFYQMNRTIWMLDQVIGTGLTGPGAAGGTLTIPAGTIPANINTILIKAGRTDATIFIAAFAPDASGVCVQCGCQSTSPALNGLMSAATLEVVLNSNASLFWQTADAGTTYRVVACGYTF